MRIGIITVYNSHNYGSYLQASCLKRELEQFGDVVFYNSKSRGLIRSYLRKIKKIVKSKVRNLDIVKGALFELVEMFRLKKCWSSLNSTLVTDGIDVAVLGSDEIWNLGREVCRYPVYWGANILAYKIAYAPSINTANKGDIDQFPDYINYLKYINNVSVRDTHSREILASYLNSEPKIVLDPTLLFPVTTWTNEATCFKDKRYIAVYLFYGSLSTEEINAIIGFAKKKHMPLVSAGQYISWCDYSVHSKNGDPFWIFKSASFVITNTFHGVAFAINHSTQFVALVKGKTKVEGLLEMFELSNRIANNPTDISIILDTSIDYYNINHTLIRYRKMSRQYLLDSFTEYQRQRSIDEK